ncbi:MAG: dienelactone hydrolase family protein [Cytophagales bacterium]|nr:dienelactone hydrolase family protein [Cytophagales bacterium]
MKRNPTYLIAICLMLLSACSTPKSEEQQSTAEATTPAVEVPKGEITYSADTIDMKGYFATNAAAGAKVPGILVIHEWWGHNDYARKRADMLADLGYVALAIDMYGDGKVAEHPQDAGKFSGMVFQNLDQSRAKFEAALKTLQDHPNVDPDKIAAIGYCFGGAVAINMANAGYDLDAVAAFHSSLGMAFQPNAETLKAKILVCNGADDPFISEESIVAFKQAYESFGTDMKYVSYPGAVHSFTSKEADANGEKFNLPLAYNEEADAASWKEMQELFASVF